MPNTINPLYTIRGPTVKPNRTKKSVGFSKTASLRVAEGTYSNPWGNTKKNITVRTKGVNGIIPRAMRQLPPGSLQRARKNNINHIKNNSTCVPGDSVCLPFWPFSRGGSGKTRRNRNKRSKTRSYRKV